VATTAPRVAASVGAGCRDGRGTGETERAMGPRCNYGVKMNSNRNLRHLRIIFDL
jgi:hypothetical protein